MLSETQKTYGGKKRSDLKAGDFLYSDNGEGKFPIVTPQDVADAIPNLNRPGLSKPYAEIKRLLIARAKAKGSAFVARLPKAWKVEKSASEMSMPDDMEMPSDADAADEASEGAAPKFDPAAVDYTANGTMPGDQCKDCLYFQMQNTAEMAGGCALVNGTISPAGSCDLFTTKPVITGGSPETDPLLTPMTEMTVIRETYTSSFGGKYPDVPTAPGVDYNALVANDPEPFFVTLPIAEVGRTSDNGLHYDEELVTSIAEQINRDRPTGIRGHIKDTERSTAYPSPEIYWVGAKRFGAKLYAKGYIPPGGAGSAREEYRIHKATRAPIATSIYGKPLSRTALPDGTYKIKLGLEHVDLAPYRRAALKLGGDFAVTHEMAEERGQEMDANELRTSIAALTSEALAEMLDAAAQEKLVTVLAAKQRKVVVAETAVTDSAALAELQSAQAASTQTIKELTDKLTVQETAIAEFHRKEFARELDSQIAALTQWQVKDPANQAKLDALRSMLRTQVVAEFAGSFDLSQIAAKSAAVLEAQKPIVEAVRDALAGPTAFVAGQDNRSNAPTLKLASREDSDAARAELGI
jgi:hypothetical protein